MRKKSFLEVFHFLPVEFHEENDIFFLEGSIMMKILVSDLKVLGLLVEILGKLYLFA